MKHRGDLVITKENLSICAALAEVTGALYVRAAGAQFPALVKTGWLYVRAAGAQFPALVKTGWLYVQAEGAQFPLLGRVIAFSTWGLVRLNDGRYSAGCHQKLTRAEALAHWGGRKDRRAKLFTAAIEESS